MEDKHIALGAGAFAFVLFVLFIIFYAEVIYSYGAGFFALVGFIILVGLALEFRSRRETARRAVGGASLIAGLMAFGGFIAACVNAARPDNAGTGQELKAVFVLFTFIGCVALAYVNIRVQGEGSVADKSLVALENGDGLDSNTAGNKCLSCCKSTCWVFLMLVVCLASANTMMLASEGRKFLPTEEKFVDVNGHKIFTRCMGEGSPTVYFEHGLGGNSLDFSWVQQNLSQVTRTCSFDRAGYGRSVERGPLPRVSSQLADESKAVLDSLNISEAIFIGHSFAGFNMRVLEAKYPEMFLGMVMVDMVNPNNTAFCDPNETYGSPLEEFGMYTAESGILRILNLIGFLDGFVPLPKLPESVQEEYKSNLYRVGYFRTRTDEFLYWGRNCDYVKNLKGEEKLLDFPLTVIAPTKGIHSNNMKYAAEMADLSPRGTYIEIDEEDADHVSVLFDPKYAKYTIEAALGMIEEYRAGNNNN